MEKKKLITKDKVLGIKRVDFLKKCSLEEFLEDIRIRQHNKKANNEEAWIAPV